MDPNSGTADAVGLEKETLAQQALVSDRESWRLLMGSN